MTMLHDDDIGDDDECNTSRLKRKGDKLDQGGKLMKKNKHCRASKAKWSPEEDETLARAVMISGEGNWKKIAQSLNDRSHLQCLHRWQKVLNPALVKGPWKEEEDAKLTELVEKYGPKDWSTIASHIPGRIGKQCRERWFNHLSPDVRKTNWSPEEDRIIIDAHSKIGNKWTNISKLLEGRPANAIKNHWNSTLLKRIQDSTGEPTPRRDRTRTKKPMPMRAAEFDFRTQLRRSMEESAHCTPQHYLHSPASSPEMPYQEPHQLVNMRFQYPTETIPQHQPVYFTPFNINSNTHELANHSNNSNMHAPASYSSAAAVWDSWPTPNVIHLNPSSVPTLLSQQAVSHNIASQIAQLGHFLPVGFTQHNNINNTNSATSNTIINNNDNQHNGNDAQNNITQNNGSSNIITQNDNDTNNNHTTNSSTNNTAMNMYEVEYGLGLVPEPTHNDLMEMYHSNQQSGATLPVELQYCFDHSQQGSSSMDSFAPLSIDSSGMNINSMNMSTNLSMGLLNIDMPSLYPLDL